MKLKILVGRLLCAIDQIIFSFLRECSNRYEIMAP